MAELIAEETITALHRSGQRVEVKAGVGRPYPIGDSEWACPVSLSGLPGAPPWRSRRQLAPVALLGRQSPASASDTLRTGWGRATPPWWSRCLRHFSFSGIGRP